MRGTFPQDKSGTVQTTRWYAKPVDPYWTWTAVSYFDDYVEAQSSMSDTRMRASYYEYNAGAYTFSNPSNLLGAAALVPGTDASTLGHAVIITAQNGLSRNQLYYSAHTADVQNARLSDYYSSTMIKFIVPTSMVHVTTCEYGTHTFSATVSGSAYDSTCNKCGECNLYIKNNLQGRVSMGSTVTLTGQTNMTCYRMAMKVQRVGSSTVSWLGEVTNTSTYSKSYTFSQAGLYVVTLYARDTNPDLYPEDTTSVDCSYVIRVG